MMSFINPLFSLALMVSILSILMFSLQRKHLLNVLLSLEMVMLSIFMILISTMNIITNDGLTAFVMLTFMACEAALGLSMLVILIRSHGNDYVSSLSMHKC